MPPLTPSPISKEHALSPAQEPMTGEDQIYSSLDEDSEEEDDGQYDDDEGPAPGAIT